jgi:hypothetical protein
VFGVACKRVVTQRPAADSMKKGVAGSDEQVIAIFTARLRAVSLAVAKAAGRRVYWATRIPGVRAPRPVDVSETEGRKRSVGGFS